jgi:hypothetical protein
VVTGTTPTAIHSGSTAAGTPDSITVKFGDRLIGVDARAARNYDLRSPGVDGLFDTGDDVVRELTATLITTDPAGDQVLLTLAAPLGTGTYRLTVFSNAASASGLHDLSGLLLDGDGDGVEGGNYRRTFTVGGDVTAPSVVSTLFVRSAPRMNATFTLSEDVGASLSIADFVLRNTTNAAIGVIDSTLLAMAYDPVTGVATLTYTGSANGVLPDGRYTLTLLAGSVSDAAGNVLAADHVLKFTIMTGDFNEDGAVTFADLVKLAQNYGQSGGKTHAQGDSNYDGIVNFADLVALARNYNQSVATE